MAERLTLGAIVGLAGLAGCGVDSLEPLEFDEPALVRGPCAQILHDDPGAEDGTYAVPDAEALGGLIDEVYCNHSEYGGGWTLWSKVRRLSAGAEPRRFWQDGFQGEDLSEKSLQYDPDHGLASYPSYAIQANPGSVVWFELVHADEGDVRRDFFKEVPTAQDMESWFGPDNQQIVTRVCSNPELTEDCIDSKIVDDGSNLMFGMKLRDASNIGLHMQLDGHTNPNPAYQGVCTDEVFGNGVPGWPASSGADGHWGHGLRIWIR